MQRRLAGHAQLPVQFHRPRVARAGVGLVRVERQGCNLSVGDISQPGQQIPGQRQIFARHQNVDVIHGALAGFGVDMRGEPGAFQRQRADVRPGQGAQQFA